MTNTTLEVDCLKIALRNTRTAQRNAFRAWRSAKQLVQDDLSPPQRAERRRLMQSSKRLCLRAARQAGAVEWCILRLTMD